MIIALDYDDTFTRDPHAWLTFCEMMRHRGHQIYGITMRYPEEAGGIDKLYAAACDKIFFTSRKAKLHFMQDRGTHVDIWIDDSPHWIIGDALQ